MKKIAVALVLIFCVKLAGAQQQALYNTRTLYDAFENPSQKAFQADSSRKYAFNFLIPTVSANAAFTGPAQNSIRELFYRGNISGTGLILDGSQRSTFSGSTNNYLLMFRVYKTVKYDREMGFSWQVKSDGNVHISNESFAIFDRYRLFNQDQYTDIFNDYGYNQVYHQFSFTYRENYNRRLSLGAKLSLLSGVTYNKLRVENSTLTIDRPMDAITVGLKGNFKSSFLHTDLDKDVLYPTFKDPGLSFTVSGGYKFKYGWFVLANLKDIGFIYWKDSYLYPFNRNILIPNASGGNAGVRLKDQIGRMFKGIDTAANFTSLTNGKAEVLVNKDLGFYQPNLILSKNLFYPGGDLALVNHFRIKNFILSASADYNLNDYFQIGGQFMIKTPNIEFFLGSDQLFKTYSATRSLIKSEYSEGNAYTGASFYLGFAAKFGPAMEHQANANSIPGLGEPEFDREGFFRRLFSRRRGN